MPEADRATYLADTVRIMKSHWPENRTVNIVCHGHSVPSGYFATPMVDTFNAYPHLLHRELKHRFPFAVINVIVTAIGGENSVEGATRFEKEVLSHRPNVVTIDYGLNDRRIGLVKARESWLSMIEKAQSADVRVILLTPTHDITQAPDYRGDDSDMLPQHAEQIRRLAQERGTGLADSFAAFRRYGTLTDLLSWGNHPNRKGHELVSLELLRWFPVA